MRLRRFLATLALTTFLGLPVWGQSVDAVYSASSTDPEGQPLTWLWSISPTAAMVNADTSVVTITFDTPGNYSLTVSVSDGTNAPVVSQPFPIIVTRDQAPSEPSINGPGTVILPEQAAVVSGTEVLRADASDNIGVTEVLFWLDNQIIGTGTLISGDPLSGTWELPNGWDTTQHANARYALSGSARDAALNRSQSASRLVDVAN